MLWAETLLPLSPPLSCLCLCLVNVMNGKLLPLSPPLSRLCICLVNVMDGNTLAPPPTAFPPLPLPLSRSGFRSTRGRVEALGFALIRRKSGGLKHEYRDKDGKALGTLK